MGDNQDPVTLHKYLYANSNPVYYTDPSGNISLGSVMSAINVMGRLATTAIANVGRSALSKVRFMVGKAPPTKSLQWGFWRDLPKKFIGGKKYADIGGRGFSREAVNRMTPRAFGTAAGGQAGRGITPTVVAHVIRHAKLLGKYKRTINARGGTGYIREIYELSGIRVVTEANNRIVITVLKMTKGG